MVGAGPEEGGATLLAGTEAGVPPPAGAGTSSAAAGIPVPGDPRSVVGAALAGTGLDSDGVVVVETGSVVEPDSAGVGSDRQDAHPGSSLGPTLLLSPSVVGIGTVGCAGVGCGAGLGAGSGSALIGVGAVGSGSEGGGGSVPVGGVSIGGGVLTGGTGGVVGGGVGAGSKTGFPLPIGGPSHFGCSLGAGCSFAQASLELRIETERHKTSATSRARDLRLRRWAWRAVLMCGFPRVKSVRTRPIVPR